MVIRPIQDPREFHSALCVNLGISDIDYLERCIVREYAEEQLEVFRSQIILRQVEALKGTFVLPGLQCNGQVLQAKRIVEKLLEREVLELVLILHLHLDDLGLVQVFVTDEILGQVDVCHTRVALQELRQDEDVLRVQVLFPQIELDKVVHLDR